MFIKVSDSLEFVIVLLDSPRAAGMVQPSYPVQNLQALCSQLEVVLVQFVYLEQLAKLM